MIVKMSALGDVVQSLSALDQSLLRAHYDSIHWVCEKASAPLVALSPFVDQVITLDLKQWRTLGFWLKRSGQGEEGKRGRAWKEVAQALGALRSQRYSCALDLQGNLKSALVTALLRSKERVGMAQLRERVARFFYHRRLFLPAPPKSARVALISYANALCKEETREERIGGGESRVYAAGEAAPLAPALPDFSRLDQAARERIDRLVAQHCLGFLIAPGSVWKNKQLSASIVSTFLEALQDHEEEVLGNKIGEAPVGLITWGNEKERQLGQSLQRGLPKREEHRLLLCGEKFSVDALAYLLSKLRFVVAGDSLLLHLAHWCGISSFSFFGPTSALYYGPSSVETPRVSSIQGVSQEQSLPRLSPRGIHHFWQGSCPYGVSFTRRCPALKSCHKAPCMHHLPPKELKAALRRFFRALPPF